MADEWVQAKNLVRQQVEIMVNELEELSRRVANQRASIDVLQKERDAAIAKYNDLPSMRVISENAELRRQVRELTQTNEKYREYMKLKDNAKIKVEGQRDYWKDQAQEAKRVSRVHADRERFHLSRITELEALNAKQAEAFVDLEKRLAKKDELIRQHSAENGRLIEVIKLGRKGIEGEGRDWELGHPRGW